MNEFSQTFVFIRSKRICTENYNKKISENCFIIYKTYSVYSRISLVNKSLPIRRAIESIQIEATACCTQSALLLSLSSSLISVLYFIEVVTNKKPKFISRNTKGACKTRELEIIYIVITIASFQEYLGMVQIETSKVQDTLIFFV